ncbi:cation diffusion facilitator family transporter [Salinirussus salinus]|uniref:cation diffusion facilitator family transporter n=1 Tax=Salinirussus salinus TaxID=1198300 RepID=UPI00135B6909|nr:cation diffusion facilitator family transporter [Salinirussus salinus]
MSRRTALRRVGLLVLGVNAVLFVAKGGVYLETGSLAVGSEAVNSLADTVYSLVVVAGLYLTTRPPDFEHPHGHERIEPFVSLFVALGIFAAGGAVLWQAGSAVLEGSVTVSRSPAAVAVLAGTAAAKYLLYRYCLRAGTENRSPALVATALDNRNDILTAGAALAGVLGAGLGYPVLDPLAAGVVAVGILYTGVEVVRDNVDYLVGAAPPEDLRAEIVERALVHEDVEGVHDVIAHYVGPEIDVSLHVEVSGDRTLREAHDIETDIVERIGELPEVDDVFVHVDPKELGEWKEDADVDRLVQDDETDI